LIGLINRREGGGRDTEWEMGSCLNTFPEIFRENLSITFLFLFCTARRVSPADLNVPTIFWKLL
jgi:hypothetical protein